MNAISVTYTDAQLRILIEEFIAMQRSQFSFRGVCSYILYRAIEEGCTASDGLYDSNQLSADDCKRVNDILEKIKNEGRIIEDASGGNYCMCEDEAQNNELSKATISYVSGLTLNEVLVKNSYFVQSNKPGDKKFLGEPEAYGTGFMVLYKGMTFFVTADHVAHVKDHDLEKRTGENNVVGVHTYTRQELTAQVILLSETYYAEKYDIKNGKNELVDVCVTPLSDEQESTMCFTPEIELPERTIQKGEQMLIVCEDGFIEPNIEDTFYVCGHTRPHIKNGIFIEYQKAFKKLEYKLSDKEHLLFNSENVIEDADDWHGISGAPIFNQEGKCVGVLTSVNEDSKMVWGYSYKTIIMLMNMAINDIKNIK